MERANERHVLGLDLIRFAAAAMVMAFHYGHDIGPIPLSWAGWVGVEIFFVLSGYVIAASAESAAPWAFARNRIVRLMPAVWLCSTAIAGLCLVQATYPDLGARYLRSIMLWPTGTWLDGVFWTLPVEVIFYAAVFLALLWRWPLGLVLRLIGAASAAYWMLRLAALLTHRPLPIVPDPVVTLSLLGFGCYFALGGIMREAVTKGWTLERGAVAVVGIAAGLVQIAFAASNWSPGADLSWLPHAQKAAPAITWLVLSALMIASARLNPL
ncbi:MAG TPA: acyltransferase, partial [Caulobacteraceae bacterium]|nr:acyltransferase [Caulobacteraceae bacterium]